MDLATQRLMAAAAGGGKNPGDNIDTFFHTAVWDGDGTGTTVYPGVDWFGSGKEALFMLKDRDQQQGSWWYDTVRGDRKGLQPMDTATETTNISSGAWDVYDINSSNATFKTGGNYNWVPSSGPMKAHCFRTGSGFFDIVTWTGNATDNRAIAHNLQCKPGAIFIKCRNRSSDWRVWHKAYGSTKAARLNARNRFTISGVNSYWGTNGTAPTSTHFTIGTGDPVNKNGYNFIAYVFADGDDADAQIFGREGDASLIKCGSFTQTGSTVEVDIGWEPQFIIFKTNPNSDSSTTWGNWYVMDSTTGFSPYRQNRTKLSQGGAESDYSSQQISENDDILYPYARGFRSNMAAGSSPDHYTNEPIEYIAIRRPDAVVGYKGLTGEQYFRVKIGETSASRENAAFQVQFDKRVVDLAIVKKLNTSDNWKLTSRQIMNGYFTGVNSGSGRNADNEWGMDFDGRNETDGFIDAGGNWDSWWAFMWCRDAGLSTQYYVGTGTGQWIYHDLYQKPGMIWYKKVSGSSTWTVWHMGLNEGTPDGRHISLSPSATEQNDNAYFDGAGVSDTRHRVKGSTHTGASGEKYVAYFFGDGIARGSGDYGANGAAISKCGYYTGSSSQQTITLGFAPRLWLSKRVDGSGGGGHWNLASKDANNSRGHNDWQYDYWLDDNGNQATGSVSSANSTSITLNGGGASNTNNGKYIYYAHS